MDRDKTLKTYAFKSWLTPLPFSELWEIYKGIDKSVRLGEPVIVRSFVLTEEEISLLLEVLYEEIKRKIQQEDGINKDQYKTQS